MKQQYLVGGNLFTVSAPDGLSAWATLAPRFAPFATDEASTPVFEADIRAGELPQCEGEMIYQPDFGGIGLITSRASLQADGSIIMEFEHIEQRVVRLWMRMSPLRDRVEIVIVHADDGNDPYFLTHALMVAYMLATTGNGTLMIHSSSVIYGGKAYLFQGKSGTGKSTHAALWTANIEGAELLNDDNPLIRFAPDGTPMAYGSPWSGKTHCYRNVAAPIGAMVRIVRAPRNELRRLAPLAAYASLTASVLYLPFLRSEDRDMRHATIERLVAAVPVCEMHCRPDPDAALTCRAALIP